MTKFTDENLIRSNEYLMYHPEGGNSWTDRKFVARFKYAQGGLGAFKTFLKKHFTVEEYFEQIAAGKSPLTILEDKGFLLPHVKKALKARGYEISKAGKGLYIKDQVERYKTATVTPSRSA